MNKRIIPALTVSGLLLIGLIAALPIMWGSAEWWFFPTLIVWLIAFILSLVVFLMAWGLRNEAVICG